MSSSSTSNAVSSPLGSDEKEKDCESAFSFSAEQLAVIDGAETCCQTVDAVAGSGKTTTIVGLAEKYPDKKIIVLTYNNHLAGETSVRLPEDSQTKIYTVHGFVYQFYDSSGYTERILVNAVKEDMPPKRPFRADIVVLDEVQDFNEYMFRVVVKLLKDAGWTRTQFGKLILLGDKYQMIYDTMQGSDNRYLIFADKIFTFLTWSKRALRTTYRLNRPAVDLMNRVFLKTDLFVSEKDAPYKPIFMVADVFSQTFFNSILGLIQKGKYKPDEVFILAPSVKLSNPNRPLSRLVNFLSNKGIPLHVCDTTEGSSFKEVLTNKLVVGTYHICKGRERRLVIVFNADHSYYQYFSKEKDGRSLTNTQYVAFTRATELVVFVQGYKETPFLFVDQNELRQLTDYRMLTECSYSSTPRYKNYVKPLSVTSLLEYCNFHLLDYCLSQCQIQTMEEGQDQFALSLTDVPSHLQMPYKSDLPKAEDVIITENVSNLNGLIVTLVYEQHKRGNLRCVEYLKRCAKFSIEQMEVGSQGRYDSKVANEMLSLSDRNLEFPKDFTHLALVLEAHDMDSFHRFKQVTKRDWLTKEHEEKIIRILSDWCGAECRFEVSMRDTTAVRGKFLEGRLDIVDHTNKRITEIKFVEHLSDAHLVQVVLYYYLAVKVHKKYLLYDLYVLNVRDGCCKKVIPPDWDSVVALVDYLVYKKENPDAKITDEEFIERAKKWVDDAFPDVKVPVAKKAKSRKVKSPQPEVKKKTSQRPKEKTTKSKPKPQLGTVESLADLATDLASLDLAS